MLMTRSLARWLPATAAFILGWLPALAGGCKLPEQPLNDLVNYQVSATAVAFSPDGRTLAVGSASMPGEVSLWSTATAQRILTLPTGHLVGAVAFSPDGLQLATSGVTVLWNGNRPPLYRARAELWELATGNKIDLCDDHESQFNQIDALAFSPNGTLATAHASGGVKLWDVHSGKERLTLGKDVQPVRSLAFSPNGLLLATGGSDSLIRIWDLATGKTVATLRGHTGPILSLAFCPDSASLISGGASSDGTTGELKVWDVTTGQQRAAFQCHAKPVLSVAVTRDGQRMASGSQDGAVKVRELPDGRECFAFERGGNFTALAFSPDGKLLATAEGTGNTLIASGGVHLWDMTTGAERTRPPRAVR